VLNQDSVILGEKIRILDLSRIIRVISHLDDDYIEQLELCLSTILGLHN
jgi:mRNA interferase MazF